MFGVIAVVCWLITARNCFAARSGFNNEVKTSIFASLMYAIAFTMRYEPVFLSIATRSDMPNLAWLLAYFAAITGLLVGFTPNYNHENSPVKNLKLFVTSLYILCAASIFILYPLLGEQTVIDDSFPQTIYHLLYLTSAYSFTLVVSLLSLIVYLYLLRNTVVDHIEKFRVFVLCNLTGATVIYLILVLIINSIQYFSPSDFVPIKQNLDRMALWIALFVFVCWFVYLIPARWINWFIDIRKHLRLRQVQKQAKSIYRYRTIGHLSGNYLSVSMLNQQAVFRLLDAKKQMRQEGLTSFLDAIDDTQPMNKLIDNYSQIMSGDGDRFQKIMKLVSFLTYPFIIAPVSFFAYVLSKHPTSSVTDWFMWMVLPVTIVIAPVMTYIGWKYRQGTISDLDVSERGQRSMPFSLALIAAVPFFISLWFIQPPNEVVIPLCVAALATVVTFVITTVWTKISLHSVASAGCIVLLFYTHPVAGVVMLLLTVLSGYSRVALKKHTWKQVILGWLIGLVMTGAAFVIFKDLT